MASKAAADIRSPEKIKEFRHRIFQTKCMVIDADPETIGFRDGFHYANLQRVVDKTQFIAQIIGGDDDLTLMNVTTLNTILAGVRDELRPLRQSQMIIFRKGDFDPEILASGDKVLAYAQEHDPKNMGAWRYYIENEAAAYSEEMRSRWKYDETFEFPVLQSDVLRAESKKLLFEYFDAPVPHPLLPKKMKEMCRTIRQQIEEKVNPIAIAAFAHMRLVELHPFEDQNGRTARFFMNMILHRFELPPLYFYSEKEYLAAVENSLEGRSDKTQYERFASYLSRKVYLFQNLIKLAQEESVDPEREQAFIAEAGFLTCEKFYDSAFQLNKLLSSKK